MNSNFYIEDKSKKTVEFINKKLISYPRKELILKHNIEKTCYKLIENIYSYNINNMPRIKEKYLKDALVNISMLDYYMETSYKKHILNNKEIINLGTHFIEIKRMIYGLLKNENKI